MTQPESSEQPSVEPAEDAETEADRAADEVTDSERLSELEAELVELRAQHARAVADYQNLRRRSAEERREYARVTQKAAVLNYLPVLDDLRRALDAVAEHEEIAEHPWLEGMQMVQRKFLAVLEAGGVKEIEAEGCAFDPALHEAVSYQPGPEGQVVGVVQSGYTLDGLVIRPTMVLVGNDPAAGDDQTGDQEAAGEAAVDEIDDATDESTTETTADQSADEAERRDGAEG